MALRTWISPSRKGSTPSRNGNKVHYSAFRNGSKPITWRFIILLGSVQSPSQLFSWSQWEVFNLSLVISAEQYNQWGRVTKTPYRVRPKLQWTNCCRSPALISSTSRSHSIQLQLSKFLTSPKLPMQQSYNHGRNPLLLKHLQGGIFKHGCFHPGVYKYHQLMICCLFVLYMYTKVFRG